MDEQVLNIIDKACEWLRRQTDQEYPGAPRVRIFDDYEINEFRKEMMGEKNPD